MHRESCTLCSPQESAGSLCFVRNLIKTTLGPGCNQCDAIKAGPALILNTKTCLNGKHEEENLPQSQQGHFWVFWRVWWRFGIYDSAVLLCYRPGFSSLSDSLTFQTFSDLPRADHVTRTVSRSQSITTSLLAFITNHSWHDKSDTQPHRNLMPRWEYSLSTHLN